MRQIRSVPYAVSARWLFYRLLQAALYAGKEDYHGKFLPLTAKAFYTCPSGQWRPNTLADDTRSVDDGGLGYDNERDWLQGILDFEGFSTHKWATQPYYMEIWFEAKAMRGQFQYYTSEIPLLPFGGDVSIPAKWETAARITRRAHTWGKPVVVLYFGDDDPKGQEIPQNAMRDIEAWCKVPITFWRVGLNAGQGAELGISENPEKPGTYQWEALDDDQAGQIIQDAVGRYYDHDALEAAKADEESVTDEFKLRFQEFINDWEAVLP